MRLIGTEATSARVIPRGDTQVRRATHCGLAQTAGRRRSRSDAPREGISRRRRSDYSDRDNGIRVLRPHKTATAPNNNVRPLAAVAGSISGAATALGVAATLGVACGVAALNRGDSPSLASRKPRRSESSEAIARPFCIAKTNRFSADSPLTASTSVKASRAPNPCRSSRCSLAANDAMGKSPNIRNPTISLFMNKPSNRVHRWQLAI